MTFKLKYIFIYSKETLKIIILWLFDEMHLMCAKPQVDWLLYLYWLLHKHYIFSPKKEDAGLVQAAEKTCQNADVQKDINHWEEELANGNKNPGIGHKSICKGIIKHRSKNDERFYVRESDGVIESLAKSGKKKVINNSS